MIRWRRGESIFQEFQLQMRMESVDVTSIVVDTGSGKHAIRHEAAKHLLGSQREEILLMVVVAVVVVVVVSGRMLMPGRRLRMMRK